MNDIKFAKWRVLLFVFFFLTSGNLAIDYLYKMPLRNAMLLLLNDSVVPAVFTVGLYLFYGIRKD